MTEYWCEYSMMIYESVQQKITCKGGSYMYHYAFISLHGAYNTSAVYHSYKVDYYIQVVISQNEYEIQVNT